jgi:hypothetical protein
MPSDLFVMEAIRLKPKRAIRYVVVEGGHHAFETEFRGSRAGDLFNDFLEWALDPGRITSTVVR